MITKSKKGFTIIEVVLVLAIAGLIFLMVFIALPNMQRSQRDTQRRNDFSALSANITQYMTNNNGKLPDTTAKLGTDPAKNYINSTGEDPNGYTYNLTVADCSGKGNAVCMTLAKATNSAATQVVILRHAQCKDGQPYESKGNRSYAVFGQLEAGVGYYCQSNNS